MKTFSALFAAMATTGLAFTGLAATTQVANAVVYCTYIGYPGGCVARPGVRLVARPVGVGHVGGVAVRRPAGVGHVGVAPRRRL